MVPSPNPGSRAFATALLLGGFGAQDQVRAQDIATLAPRLAALHKADPSQLSPDLRTAWELMNEGGYVDQRRRYLPPPFERPDLMLFDAVLRFDDMVPGQGDHPWIVCMARPGSAGNLWQLPPGIAVVDYPERTAPG